MKKNRIRFGLFVSMGLALCATNSLAAPNVNGRFLTDENGTPIVLRGFTLQHHAQRFQTQQEISEVASTGANTVKIRLDAGTMSNGPKALSMELKNLLDWSKANNVFAIIEINNSKKNIEKFWNTDEIKFALLGSEENFILDVTEKTGSENLGNEQKYTIEKLRKSGINNTFIVDAESLNEKNADQKSKKAKMVFESDINRNTIFEIDNFKSENIHSPIKIIAESFTNKNLVAIIGQAQPKQRINNEFIDSLLQDTNSNNYGFIGWDWKYNNQIEKNNIIHQNEIDRIINGPNGIRHSTSPTGISEELASSRIDDDNQNFVTSENEIINESPFLLKAGQTRSWPVKRVQDAISLLMSATYAGGSYVYQHLPSIGVSIQLAKGTIETGLSHILARHAPNSYQKLLPDTKAANAIRDPNAIMNKVIMSQFTPMVFAAAATIAAANMAEIRNLTKRGGGYLPKPFTAPDGTRMMLVLQIRSACESVGKIKYIPAIIHTVFPIYQMALPQDELKKKRKLQMDNAVKDNAAIPLNDIHFSTCTINRPSFSPPPAVTIMGDRSKQCVTAPNGVPTMGKCNTNDAVWTKTEFVKAGGGGGTGYLNLVHNKYLCFPAKAGLPMELSASIKDNCMFNTTDLVLGRTHKTPTRISWMLLDVGRNRPYRFDGKGNLINGVVWTGSQAIVLKNIP